MQNKRNYLFGTTVLAGLMAITAPAVAQTQQPAPATQPGQDATEIGEVVVTGSRIRRDPTTAPTPLIQVQREQLLESGLGTVVDYLATIPALSNSVVPSDTTGAGLNDGGLEFANLRSLGSGRTLTLVDGRRHVGSSVGNLAVDVSVIPRLLIQSIEIVTGGGSSVYGADAVSGVVNYIMRRDFEGLEIDANYGQLVQGGAADTRRVSVLAGANLLDDRLNVYAHGEYERIEEVFGEHINWLRDGRLRLGIDADPTNAAIGPATDGFLDIAQFYGIRRLDRPMWGSTTLANMQRPSPQNDPDIPYGDCPGGNTTNANCFSVDPAYTYWFDGPTARLADFGQRVGVTGLNRPWNIGGDGEPANLTSFDQRSRNPFQEAKRFQVGANFAVTDDINLTLEAKYTTEDAYDQGQKSFWDIFINNGAFACGGQNVGVVVACNSGTSPGLINGSSTFTTRIDNAFLPANLRAAITANTFQRYTQPGITTPGQPCFGTGTATPPTGCAGNVVSTTPTVSAAAQHRGFGIDRGQANTREIQRYVAALDGGMDRLLFIDNFNWSFSYVYGEMENLNEEFGPDAVRFAHAMDSVVDAAGVVNGTPGQIVCRVQLLRAQGLAVIEQNPLTARTTYGTGAAINDPEVNGCVPLNVFGAGNQSQAAIDYFSTSITVRERNEQEQAVFSFGGELGDLLGAGPLGFAVGAEYRREGAEGIGRSADTNQRLLQLNTGADFLPAEYESEEAFAELSLPLIRDHWLGEFAELSASYRYFDYSSAAGTGDVYGVNLVYRPIQDITFKTSYNTSFRAPNLNETNRGLSQTFVNAFVDPCDTRVIAAFAGENAAAVRANRVANCTALAAQKGLTFDFGQSTVGIADDYRPTYASGVASSLGPNPGLRPERSNSFTFSVVLEPRFIPDFSLILDYYEIQLEDVITTPTGQFLANDCVNGEGLNPLSCSFVFRNNPTTQDPFDNFKVGAPGSDAVGGFILAGVNNAKLETRGLDFTINYRKDLEELFGRNLGTVSWSLGGLWLIDQKNFTNPANPAAFTDSTTGLFFPRTEFTSRVTWTPNDKLAITWQYEWQSAQDLRKFRDTLPSGNLDIDYFDAFTTEDFATSNFSVRYNLTDEVTLRGGVTNAFDAEPPPYLGFASSFEPFGRRFNVGINYRPY
jgi:outer membrane receptor protein involved in Fe transport